MCVCMRICIYAKVSPLKITVLHLSLNCFLNKEWKSVLQFPLSISHIIPNRSNTAPLQNFCL